MSGSTRKVRALGLVVAVGLAFGAGSTGVASASGLTTKAVKKIAGKVVAKKAATLSVAHADTATSATLLGGSTAAQLKTTAYRYTLPLQSSAAQLDFTFPGLPAGTYLVSYSATFNAASGLWASCQVQPTGAVNETVNETAQVYADATVNGYLRCSGSNLVTTTSATRLEVIFHNGTSAGSGAVAGVDDHAVTFVPVDTVVSTSTAGTGATGGLSGGAGSAG